MEIGSKHRYAIPLLPLEAHRVPLGERWAVVLAGGEGRRMRPAIHRWFGEARPKQFCAFIGKRTMLEHTWARARQIVKDRNVLTMAMAGHEHWLRECGTGEIPGEVVYQPCDRGTAATVFLGLAKILARDSKATIILMPSDHFIRPEARFIRLTRAALDLVEADPTRLLLMAAKASRPETEYGWIELSNPGPENNGQDENSLSVGQVTAFYEKPDLQTAQRLQRRGCFWSTMIVVAKAKTLWRLGWQFQPALMDAMDFIRRVAISVTHGRVCADHVRLAIAHAYRNIGAEDFSSVLLNRAATSSLAVPLEDIEWNDWGQPERIVETVQHGFYRATFPLGSARSPLNAMEAGGQNAAHPHQR